MLSFVAGVDLPLLVDGEEDRALEALPPGQDLGELRDQLLRAILVVGGDQDDVLPLAGPVRALDDDPGLAPPRAGRARRTINDRNNAARDHRGRAAMGVMVRSRLDSRGVFRTNGLREPRESSI